jgi:hypothetical protein
VNEVTMEIKHFSRISAWDEKKERKRRWLLLANLGSALVQYLAKDFKHCCFVRMRRVSWDYNSALVQYLSAEFKHCVIVHMRRVSCGYNSALVQYLSEKFKHCCIVRMSGVRGTGVSFSSGAISVRGVQKIPALCECV